jgi:dTDP-4-dehydrorhamnose reductase
VTAPPRVLVTGGGGQVGTELAAAFSAAGWDVDAPARAELDVTDRAAVHAAIEGARPDAVVNGAAFTAVDACEAEVDRAYLVNALGVRHLAEASRRVGAHLCHISTDYVFDGTKDGPYVEWDAPNPQSVYGRSKLGGEVEAGPEATVVRTSWVCGVHGANLVKTVLRLAEEPGRELAFVDDQRGCLTVADDLAGAIVRLVVDRRSGVHHVTNQGAQSWYELVRDVLVAAGHDGGRVRPITTAELDPPRPAPRPANSVLDNAVLRLEGLPLLPHHDEALPRLVARLVG